MSDEVLLSKFRGVMLGAAVGDALGAPVEFFSSARILTEYPGGISSYDPAYGRKGAITDDTQMTLFTAEGLILADYARCIDRTDLNARDETYVRDAYLRWFETQTEVVQSYKQPGWLLSIPELHSRRAPGNTCMSALAQGAWGTMTNPINDSKGCGGVMRVAPVALAYANQHRVEWMHSSPDKEAFITAGECAAATHGHPSGYFSAAALAYMLVRLLDGDTLGQALAMTEIELDGWSGAEETAQWLRSAYEFSQQEITPQSIDAWCGGSGGWVGEEALAIAVACALEADSFFDGVKLAANHSGDTDSTAQIAGAILGAIHGVEAIPPTLLKELELADEIRQMADDLYHHFAERRFVPDENERARYQLTTTSTHRFVANTYFGGITQEDAEHVFCSGCGGHGLATFYPLPMPCGVCNGHGLVKHKASA